MLFNTEFKKWQSLALWDWVLFSLTTLEFSNLFHPKDPNVELISDILRIWFISAGSSYYLIRPMHGVGVSFPESTSGNTEILIEEPLSISSRLQDWSSQLLLTVMTVLKCFSLHINNTESWPAAATLFSSRWCHFFPCSLCVLVAGSLFFKNH